MNRKYCRPLFTLQTDELSQIAANNLIDSIPDDKGDAMDDDKSIENKISNEPDNDENDAEAEGENITDSPAPAVDDQEATETTANDEAQDENVDVEDGSDALNAKASEAPDEPYDENNGDTTLLTPDSSLQFYNARKTSGQSNGPDDEAKVKSIAGSATSQNSKAQIDDSEPLDNSTTEIEPSHETNILILDDGEDLQEDEPIEDDSKGEHLDSTNDNAENDGQEDSKSLNNDEQLVEISDSNKTDDNVTGEADTNNELKEDDDDVQMQNIASEEEPANRTSANSKKSAGSIKISEETEVMSFIGLLWTRP